MTALTQQDPPRSERAHAATIRVLYRDGAGAMHFDEPVSVIPAVLGDPNAVLWVDIEDLAHTTPGEVESLLSDVFRFHPLAVEDAINDTHVPRVDDWCDYLFIVFPTVEFDPENKHVRLKELDLFLGRNYVVTYHKERQPVLEEHRRNIERDAVNRMRQGADSLLYQILDLIVGQFLPALELLDDAIDEAQDEVFHQPSPATLQLIFRIKRSSLRLHRTLAPQREVLNRLARDDYSVISASHRVYFRDVYDHVVRIHDISETLRDLIAGALDTYLSAVSNRTNEIMKVLTVVTVAFLPISFLTSFFGMNFFGESLAFKTDFPKGLMFWGTCLIMALTPLCMWGWAKRQGWF